MSLILGDVGVGKTTLSRRLFQVLKREENVFSHLMLNPVYETETEFLTALLKLFRIAPQSGTLSVVESLEVIERFLFEKGVKENQTVVLLIDEAQRLSPASLELLRTLLNYETNEYKLLQLILMAQMELLPRIRKMRNFWDRICLRYVLHPLDKSDTKAMITFRLRQAGYDSREELFTTKAMEEIYQYTQGYPRRIATICHDALEQLVSVTHLAVLVSEPDGRSQLERHLAGLSSLHAMLKEAPEIAIWGPERFRHDRAPDSPSVSRASSNLMSCGDVSRTPSLSPRRLGYLR
ncbi:MAG: AAA family ATPase [Planctomycetes bacterium]|nr:AAA family ATPase [Planctomycetota bacterium]